MNPGNMEEGNPFREEEEEMEIPRREERPKAKRRGNAKLRDEAIDLSGGFSRQNMLKSASTDTKESNVLLLGDFKSRRV